MLYRDQNCWFHFHWTDSFTEPLAPTIHTRSEKVYVKYIANDFGWHLIFGDFVKRNE